jgi:hypothetical protein
LRDEVPDKFAQLGASAIYGAQVDEVLKVIAEFADVEVLREELQVLLSSRKQFFWKHAGFPMV